MNKLLASAPLLLSLLICLSGCAVVGDKSGSLTWVYGAAAVLSCLLMTSYILLVKKKSIWFIVMFAAIAVVNVGYFSLASSSSLDQALIANRITYLGQVVLPLAMLMIIINITATPFKKWLPFCLLGLSAVVLLVAASPGYLDIYYKEVSFTVVNGAGALIKTYGPLHSIYLFYLVGYFGAMISVIVRSWIKETVDSTAHAIIIALAVFVNIGVWFIEQMVVIDFEFLSVSYIISELFLLGIHVIMNEQQRLVENIKKNLEAELAQPPEQSEEEIIPPADADLIELFIKGFDTLTTKELELFNSYVNGSSTKEIMASMNITVNTLKYHNRNLYSKLGVASRKQMLAVYRYANASERLAASPDTNPSTNQ